VPSVPQVFLLSTIASPESQGGPGDLPYRQWGAHYAMQIWPQRQKSFHPLSSSVLLSLGCRVPLPHLAVPCGIV
jgi:hypothetical protein